MWNRKIKRIIYPSLHFSLSLWKFLSSVSCLLTRVSEFSRIRIRKAKRYFESGYSDRIRIRSDLIPNPYPKHTDPKSRVKVWNRRIEGLILSFSSLLSFPVEVFTVSFLSFNKGFGVFPDPDSKLNLDPST